MRIRSQLLLVAAVVFIPGFIASVVAVEKVREAERQAALNGLKETVRASALLVDAQVQRSLGALTALAQSDHLRSGNFAAFYAEALASNQPPDVWTLLLDESGKQILNTAVPFGTPPLAPFAAERVAHALSSNRLYVSDLITGPVTGKQVTTMYLATKGFGGKRYVVAQAFAVGHWINSIQLPANRPAWLLGVMDRNGKFISRNRNATERLGQPGRPELVAAAAAADSGLIRHATLEGMEAYDAFTHSALTGWTIAVAAPVSAIETSATQAVTLLAAGGTLALIAAVLAAIYWARTFIEVIDVASQAARRVGNGEEPKLPGSTSLHEVDTLYQALADAGRLLGAEKRARTIAEAQRAHLLEQETALKEQAQRQNAAKDQFLALLGHELRNPLAAIAGATSVLSRRKDVAEPGERFLQIIERQNHHLRHIVDDLLEVSRMLSGKIVLELETFDLAACVRACVEAVRGTERAADHSLIFEDQAQPVWIHGDPVRMEQIVNNLLSNALKFSDAGTSIRISVNVREDQAVLQVADEGPGIAAELLPRIFEPFVQGPAQPGRMASGLGVGLSLVKQLVALHEGEVSVHAGEAGVGSVFRVVLPRVAASPSPTVDLPSKPHQARRILFVEDNADALESMTEILKMMGHSVVQAHSGAEALAAADDPQGAGFDVVLMDIGLPDQSGYDLAIALRKRPAMAKLRMVALTGYGQASDRERALAAGFDEHVSKPADPDQLARAIGD